MFPVIENEVALMVRTWLPRAGLTWSSFWQAFLVTSWRPLGLLFLLAILMMSLVGLLAIWAGLGRGNWFVRAAVALGCISLLLFIPAYELVVVYVIQAGLTIVVLGAWRNWRLARRAAASCGAGCQPANPQEAGYQPAPLGCQPVPLRCQPAPHSPWQFSIRDMMLLTVVVAWLSAMLARAPADVWIGWLPLLVEGSITAGLTIAATWIALSNARRWLRLPLLVVLFPAIVIVAWLSLWRRAHAIRSGSTRHSWSAGVRQTAIVVASLAIVLPVAALGWRLTHPRTFPEAAPPSPNGYDELAQASKLIPSSANFAVLNNPTRSQLKTLVSQCAPVYAPVRAALGKPCQVPPRMNDSELRAALSGVQSLREISRVLDAKGRLAAMEGRTKDAVATYIEMIRLGRVSMRGGLLCDVLVGITIESIGRHGIAQMRTSLPADECKALIPSLSDVLDRPHSLQDGFLRQAAWQDQARGWQGRLEAVVEELGGVCEVYRQAAQRGSDTELTQSRLLICELAIRAYSLEHGRNPAALADPVPKYLPSVPKDPFGGGEFIYRPTPAGYELHSRGVWVDGKPISADRPG